MDPVTTAVVVAAAITTAVGTVLAAWIQSRAQRPARGSRESGPDDRR
jgi:hypothetical protein